MVTPELRWVSLPDAAVRISGLPWLHRNAPRLWRLPADAMDGLPEGVRRQALFPAGGTLRFATDSTRLHLKATSISEHAGQGQGLDLYVDGSFWHTVPVASPEEASVCCFEGCVRARRNVLLYLPHRREVRISAVGIDKGAAVEAPKTQPEARPLVIYGSSVAQGVGVSRPGAAYGNILGRALGVEVINLGFGGAGRAEPGVVDLVASLDAGGFLFDLGKSYGMQPAAPYLSMLRCIRSAHPTAPLVCVSPIFSSREIHDPAYAELSSHTREVVVAAYESFCSVGATGLLLVDGLDLLGPGLADGLSSDGVHPGDAGSQRIADGIRRALAGLMV